MMDPYQVVFDRVSGIDIVEYASTEQGVDRVVLVSFFTIFVLPCPSKPAGTCF